MNRRDFLITVGAVAVAPRSLAAQALRPAVAAPVVCLVVILLRPERSLRDRLAGTWLTPR